MMEKQYSIVDRDYSDLELVANQGTFQKIKLTEQSKGNMDLKFANYRADSNKVVSVPTEAKSDDDKQISSEIITVANKSYEYSTVSKNKRKPIKVTDFMEKQMIKGYVENSQKLDVGSIDKELIANEVNDSFDKIADKEELNVINHIEETSVEPEDDINKDLELDLDVQESIEKDTIVPEIKDYFAENKDLFIDERKFEKPVSHEIVETRFEEPVVHESERYREVSDSIDGFSVDELNNLRKALQSERKRREELTKESEEREVAAAATKKELEQVTRMREEKINELKAFKEDIKRNNENLESQTRKVEERRQENISRIHNMYDTIADIDDMLGGDSARSRSEIGSSRRIA